MTKYHVRIVNQIPVTAEVSLTGHPKFTLMPGESQIISVVEIPNEAKISARLDSASIEQFRRDSAAELKTIVDDEVYNEILSDPYWQDESNFGASFPDEISERRALLDNMYTPAPPRRA